MPASSRRCVPPLFSTSAQLARSPRRARSPFTMSYTVSAATEQAVSASISTPVWAGRAGLGADPHEALVGLHLDDHVHERERQRVAERDQLRGALGRLDAGDPGGADHVALGRVAGGHRGGGGGRHAHRPSATARRSVTGLAPTSTMRARPSSSRWESSSGRLVWPCAARRRSGRARPARRPVAAARPGRVRRSRSTRRSPCGPGRWAACPWPSRAPRSGAPPGARRARRTPRRSRALMRLASAGLAPAVEIAIASGPVRKIAGRMKLQSGGTSTTLTSIARRSASS